MQSKLFRHTLVRTSAIGIDRVICRGLSREPTPEVHESETKVIVPLSGAFVHHIGRRCWYIDANQVAFVPAGQSTRDSHTARGDFECLTLRPAVELVDGVDLPGTALAEPDLQLLAARLAAQLRVNEHTASADAVLEELALQLVHIALASVSPAHMPQLAAAHRLAERAKAVLSPEGPPTRLSELASRLSVSPTYLTDAFRRAVGLPLARYQLRLRLARALVELPRCRDLTKLALDLGFSSHSHFTTAFRSVMHCTPSEYRRQARAAVVVLDGPRAIDDRRLVPSTIGDTPGPRSKDLESA